MKNSSVSPLLRWLRISLLLALGGCAGQAAHQEGIDLLARGRFEDALSRLQEAAEAAPSNLVFAQAYRNARQRIIRRWLGDAQAERGAGRPERAEALYQRVLRLESAQPEAEAGLQELQRDRRHLELLAEARRLLDAGEREAARRQLDQLLREDPRHAEARALRRQVDAGSQDPLMTPALRGKFQQPVSLEFRDASLKQVLEALSNYGGLNFVLDKDVPSTLTVTTVLRNVSLAEALDLVLTTNQLRQRVLNETTLLIYPDTAAKQSEHQNLVVRTFFLTNADAKQVMGMLTGILKAKNVFADEKLNLVIMRDTPEMVELGERLVAAQDIAEPEVMLEVEVLEVTRTQLVNLGLNLPDQLTLTPLASGDQLTLEDLRHLNSSRTGAAISPLVVNLHNEAGTTNILANPRIRTHNKEKAAIRIGDRVPVITTTATSTGFVSENVQYVDVGLKLEVEPTIYPNDQISIKLGLEVSSVVKEITSKAGSISYQIGARSASTLLRLNDGETQVLGGLINDQDIKTALRFPGLGQLPVLGRLFSNHNDNNQKTELILSIRPRIVRSLLPPAEFPNKFWSGTESTPRLRSPLLGAPAALDSPTAPATAPTPPAPPPAPPAAPAEVANPP